MRQFAIVFSLGLSLMIFSPKQAGAASFGDTVITVAASSGVGAILGVSTLPFYNESGEHTNNILVGAAIGAVLGVTVAVVNALSTSRGFDFEEPDEYEQADDEDFAYFSRQLMKLKTSSEWNIRGRESVVFWAPVQSLRF